MSPSYLPSSLSFSSLSPFSFSNSSTRPHLPFAAAAMAPIIAAFVLQTVGVDLHAACSVALASLLAFTGTMLWLHVLRSAWSTLYPVRVPLPAASAIALGRLPEDHSAMSETLKALGSLKYGGKMEVILAYSMDPLYPGGLKSEAEMTSMAANIPFHVSILRVSEGMSEEETLQSALDIATGQSVVVFHAGHCPKPEAMTLAAQWSGEMGHVSRQERMDGQGRSWDVQEIGVGLPAGSATLPTNRSFFQSLCQVASGGEGWYGALWRFMPWAAVQMVPLAVLLLMGQMESPELSGFPSSATSRIATSFVLSSSY